MTRARTAHLDYLASPDPLEDLDAYTSAYEVAVRDGFNGGVERWLTQLAGTTDVVYETEGTCHGCRTVGPLDGGRGRCALCAELDDVRAANGRMRMTGIVR